MVFLYVTINNKCSITDISVYFSIDTSTASRIVSKLSMVPYSILSTKYHDNNRRKKYVFLTSRGVEILDMLVKS